MKSAKLYFVIFGLLALAACNDSGGKSNSGVDTTGDAVTTDSTPAEDTGASNGPDATRDPGGPEILDFTVSPARLTDSNMVNVSVSITHPDGFAAIGGGKVIDEDGELYANFVGTGGTFAAALTWPTIQNVSRIDFTQNQVRVFIAEFFDAQNRRTRHPFEIELHCSGASACNGVCGKIECTDACGDATCDADGCIEQTALSYDSNNCGACGQACAAFETCQSATCRCDAPNTTLCSNVCADLQRDRLNCGQCGVTCDQTDACINGHCEQLTYSGKSCTYSSDCRGGECLPLMESGGICAIPCQTDNDCGEFVCDDGMLLGEKNCVKPCTRNQDCGTRESCVNPKTHYGIGPNRKICLGI